MHNLYIDGVLYSNVGDIETSREEVPYYEGRTLDGVYHTDIRYSVTNHTVTFFNVLDGKFESVINMARSKFKSSHSCGFPDNNGGFIYADYILKIASPPINKGYLRGKYYRNGVKVLFEAVNPDE